MVSAYVSLEERKVIYKNTNLFLNNLEMRYHVIEDNGVILEKDHVKYYELFIEFPFDKKYRENDVLNLSFQSGNISMIEVIKNMWEGD